MFGDAIASHLIIGSDKIKKKRGYHFILTHYLRFYAIFRKMNCVLLIRYLRDHHTTNICHAT